MKGLVGPLTVLAKPARVLPIVIGGRAPNIQGITIDERRCSKYTEAGWINRFDVGIMPVLDDPLARGKCASKVIQYMASGVPVIASPIGANADVVQVESGRHAGTLAQRLEALSNLRDKPVRARKMGMAAGRDFVVLNYSLNRNLPVLAEVIR